MILQEILYSLDSPVLIISIFSSKHRVSESSREEDIDVVVLVCYI